MTKNEAWLYIPVRVIPVCGPWSSVVGQTVSQKRAFDLFTDSAKILIRLKVRTEVVPQQGIELRPRAPFPQFQGPRTVVTGTFSYFRMPLLRGGGP